MRRHWWHILAMVSVVPAGMLAGQMPSPWWQDAAGYLAASVLLSVWLHWVMDEGEGS